MRRAALVSVIAFGALALWLWGFGGADQVNRWAIALQRDAQNAMAGALRALRAGEPGALLSLWALCFSYGFVHAAGPGHGKLVIGGYGVGARIAATRLSLLALTSSLAQAATAAVLVYLGLFVLGWGREQMTGLADNVMAPFSYALIGGVGLWLFFRGIRHLRVKELHQHKHDHHHHDHDHTHDHDHHDDGVCSQCGHAHGPTPEQAANVQSLRDAAMLIGVIAVRPCTGALFLLILTWQLGLVWAGIAGAFVMGLGTAAITVLVAFTAVGFRESALRLVSGPGVARVLALIEILAGAFVIILAGQLVLRSI